MNLTGYELHRLDQCESTIRGCLDAIPSMTDNEYLIQMSILEEQLSKRFGSDWPFVKAIFDSHRRTL